MTVPMGFEGKLYRNVGSRNSPSWSEIDRIEDVTPDDTMDEVKTTVRANGGWASSRPGLRNVGVSFTMPWNTANAGFLALAAAYKARLALDMAVMDGDIAVNGAQGIRADWFVLEFKKTQPLSDEQKVAIVLKPSNAVTPQDMVIGGSTSP